MLLERKRVGKQPNIAKRSPPSLGANFWGKKLPLFKKDLKDFFGPKKILFFRLKYLKVGKKILPDLAGFSVKCVKAGKKSYFRDEISHVLNTLNRKKNPFSKFSRAARNFFQYICHFLNDFLRKRRAQREIFFNIYVILLTIS